VSDCEDKVVLKEQRRRIKHTRYLEQIIISDFSKGKETGALVIYEQELGISSMIVVH